MAITLSNEELTELLSQVVMAANLGKPGEKMEIDIPRLPSERGCAVCGSMAFRPVGLVGGYETVLCPRHTNQWHKHISEHPTFLMLAILSVDYSIAIRNSDREAALTLKKEDRETRAELYSIGEDWVIDERASFYDYTKEDSRE